MMKIKKKNNNHMSEKGTCDNSFTKVLEHKTEDLKMYIISYSSKIIF